MEMFLRDRPTLKIGKKNMGFYLTPLPPLQVWRGGDSLYAIYPLSMLGEGWPLGRGEVNRFAPTLYQPLNPKTRRMI